MAMIYQTKLQRSPLTEFYCIGYFVCMWCVYERDIEEERTFCSYLAKAIKQRKSCTFILLKLYIYTWMLKHQQNQPKNHL